MSKDIRLTKEELLFLKKFFKSCTREYIDLMNNRAKEISNSILDKLQYYLKKLEEK